MVSILVFSIALIGEEINLSIDEIKRMEVSKPKLLIEKVEKNRGTKIMTYTSDNVFMFESDAKKACNERSSILKRYSISVIGCNIIERENYYSFSIEFLPEIKQPQLVTSIIIDDYISPKTYWNESSSRKEMENSFLKFKNSPLKPIDKEIIERNGEYGFKIKYVVKNIIKKSQKYYAIIDRINLGRYTFESEAKDSIPYLINLLKQSDVATIEGRVVQKDDYYSVEISYINKTDETMAIYNNPEYTIETYISEETFNFEDEAVKEGVKRNESFLKANLPVILNYAMAVENDWTFAMDFIVKNIYRNGNFIKKEYSIKRYVNPQIFDFETTAKEDLNEKIKNFYDAGLYPVSYKIVEKPQGYSFIIDYIQKN